MLLYAVVELNAFDVLIYPVFSLDGQYPRHGTSRFTNNEVTISFLMSCSTFI